MGPLESTRLGQRRTLPPRARVCLTFKDELVAGGDEWADAYSLSRMVVPHQYHTSVGLELVWYHTSVVLTLHWNHTSVVP